ncbi:SMP-30/gluconolactonase/LRE family protein [Jatrophihabitans sp. DSM 45814]
MTSAAGIVRSKLQVFTSLPNEFRRKDTLTPWSMLNRMGTPGDSFLEGPVFDSEGNLYVCDIEYGRVFRIDVAGGWSLVAEWDGEPNGLTFLSETELLTTDFRHGLMVIDVISGVIQPYLDRRNTERFKGVNDLVFDSKGNLYFTDQGATGLHDPSGRLYRLSPDGRLDALLSNVPSPNGLVLSTDERILYLAVTRANAVWRVPLMPDGGVAKVGQYLSVNGPAGPDGLAMDVRDRLSVAIPGRGEVWILDHNADPAWVLTSPTGRSTTNIAYGGPDRHELYCTESATGTILRATLDVAGCEVSRGRGPSH